MKKLILEEWLSLDGFAVDQDGKLDFFPASETDKFSDRDQLVFSNTLREAPWGTWRPGRVVRGDAVAEIRRLKERDGKHIVLWGSLSLAQDLIAADLIDEYHLQICPTIVGAGRRLFPGLPSYERLKRVNVRTYDTGVVFLHYEPQRQV